MRICLLANAASIHTVRWTEYFLSKHYAVHVISLEPPREMSTRVEVYVLPKVWPLKLDYFGSAGKVRKLLKQIKPDLLHAHYASGYGTLGRLSRFHPYLVSVWGADIYEFPQQSFLHRRLIKDNLSSADHVCSTSEIMAVQARRYCDRPITVTPFGVDCQQFRPNDGLCSDTEEIVIGTVKSLEEKYGVEYLVKSFALVAEKYRGCKKVKLLIAGDGSLREDLQSLAAALGVGALTHFTGHVPHDEVPKVLNTFSVFAAVSIRESESFGVAALEASACGLPVVVSRIGGLPEVVSNEVTGIIVPPGDVQATADAISRLVDDPALCHRLGAAGRAFVLENYEWNENASRMERLYESIVSRRTRSELASAESTAHASAPR